MADSRECDKIHDDLGGLLDGSLEGSLAEHVAGCDHCRDLRHELRAAGAHVADAGRDYVHPLDFEARLFAALDAARGGAAETPAVEAPRAAPVVRAPEAPREAPARAASPDAAPARSAERIAPVVPLRRRPAWLVGALVATTAAAVAPFALRALGHRHTVTTVMSAHLPSSDRAWGAQVALVSRAAADPTGGLEVRPRGAVDFAALAQGASLAPGDEVRTDARTRARLDLTDGTHLVLDRATDLVLDRAHARAARLITGALVADVAHIEGSTASITLPTGLVTVLGTRFALTAGDDRATVRVTRGAVRLTDPGGQEVLVATGQEGVVARGEAPSVSPAVDLAQSVAWSELGSEVRVEPDAPVLGLGELRARRPGQTAERDHAVSLASHAVRVRIVGNIARTEIDEVFRNDTPAELEGIYRFPLPPEAQIEKLALDVHGVMQDGAFVDRARAQAIWHGVIRNAQHTITQAQQTDDLVWVPGPWRDPALLEWQRGGRFELRIFPIPAHGTRRVQIAYTQVIAASGGVRRYVYPLAHDTNGSTRVEQFDVDVQVMGNDAARGVRARGYALAPSADAAPAGATRLAFAQGGFVPAGDLVVEYALPDRDSPVTAWAYQPPVADVATSPTSDLGGVRHDPGEPRRDPSGTSAAPSGPTGAPSGTSSAPREPTAAPGQLAAAPGQPESAYVALALRPVLPRWTDARPRDYALVVDTSRSMVGERLARAARLARGMIAEMDPRDRVTVLACDTTCREVPGGLAFAGSATVHAAEQFLGGQEAMGASDLVAQVRAASSALGATSDARDARIVYLGDGAATVGWRRPDHVAAEVARAMPGGRASLTAVALGGDADTTVLGAMARAGGGAMVPYVPGESLETAALSVLEATYGVALRDPRVELPAGLTDSAPAQLSTIRAGGEALVVARMSAPEVRGDVVLRGTVGGEPFEARWPVTVRASSSAGNAFVPRLYAATKIAELEGEPDGGAQAREQIVGLSQRFRVASRYTSLLVLESDAMYRAFNVQRDTHGAAAWTGEETAEATTAPLITAGLVGRGAPALEGVGGEAQDLAADDANGSAGGLGGAHGELDRVGSQGTLGHGAGAGYGRGGPATRAAGGDESAPASITEPDDDAAEFHGRVATATPTTPTASSAAPMPHTGVGHEVARRVSGAPAPAPVRESQAQMPLNGLRMGSGGMARPMGGQWMRRIWVRHATIALGAGTGDDGSIDAARRALLAEPDSRGRHKDLYRVLSLAGRFDEAAEVATRWSTRDALDPDALVRLAETAARHGDRDRSVRILAGVVDVRPDDVDGARRMALLHERAGQAAQACAYRIAIAEVRTTDEPSLGDAVRCTRALGDGDGAARILASVTDATTRTRIETVATGPAASTEQTPRGEVVASAVWDSPTDLDIALVDPRGNRVTWMGGRATGLTARGAHDTRSEGLGLSRATVGGWVVEVSRTGTDTTPGTVRGTVDVTVLGQRRTVSFTLLPTDTTARVARLDVTREAQMVPGNNVWQ